MQTPRLVIMKGTFHQQQSAIIRTAWEIAVADLHKATKTCVKASKDYLG
jgi:hypothetical protein